MSGSKTKGGHVVMGDNCLVCKHCGMTQSLPFPCSIRVFKAIGDAFTKDHLRCPQPTQEQVAARLNWQTPYDWRMSNDTGTSSLTIWAVLAPGGLDRNADIPYDPSDFGRCLRLVRAFDWRKRLGEVSTFYPWWKPFEDHWDDLAKLFDEEHPSGKAPKCYAMLQKCREASEAIRFQKEKARE